MLNKNRRSIAYWLSSQTISGQKQSAHSWKWIGKLIPGHCINWSIEIRATNPAAMPKIDDSDVALLRTGRTRRRCRQRGFDRVEESLLGERRRSFHASFRGRRYRTHDKRRAKAQLAFTAARAEQEKTVQAQPDYGPAWCVLGVIDAALGRKEEALREGRRAVELLPVEKDAINGIAMIKYLAIIAAWAGEKDLACEQLATAVRYPVVSPQLWRIKTDAMMGSAARRSVLRKNRRLARAERSSFQITPASLGSTESRCERFARYIGRNSTLNSQSLVRADLSRRTNFLRNEPPNPTEYLGERPEMTSS